MQKRLKNTGVNNPERALQFQTTESGFIPATSLAFCKNIYIGISFTGTQPADIFGVDKDGCVTCCCIKKLNMFSKISGGAIVRLPCLGCGPDLSYCRKICLVRHHFSIHFLPNSDILSQRDHNHSYTTPGKRCKTADQN